MAAGNNGVYIYGSNVNANSSCQISFDVRVSASGNYTNTTSAVSSAGGNSAAASAPLFGLSIAATNDSVGGIAGVSGATAVLNAFTGDTISGTPATTANSTLAVSTAVPAQLTFDTATGNVDVKPNTPAGTYSFNYQICDNTNPLNCTTATISVTVAPSADLSVTKTNTPGVNGDVDQTSDAVTTGTATTYTIIVRNNGPDTITGPIVSDTIGTGLTCPASNVVTITGSGVPVGSFNVGNLTGTGITLGTLTNGQTTRISYSCQVN